MKNRTRENCTSGSVRDEAGQPPHLLGRRQFLHLAAGATVLPAVSRIVTFTNTLMRKDLDLGLKAAKERGVALPATQVVRDIVQACIDDGQAEADYTHILDKLAQYSGMQLKSEAAPVSDGLA